MTVFYQNLRRSKLVMRGIRVETIPGAEADDKGKPPQVRGQSILMQNVNQGYEDDVEDDGLREEKMTKFMEGDEVDEKATSQSDSGMAESADVEAGRVEEKDDDVQLDRTNGDVKVSIEDETNVTTTDEKSGSSIEEVFEKPEIELVVSAQDSSALKSVAAVKPIPATSKGGKTPEEHEEDKDEKNAENDVLKERSRSSLTGPVNQNEDSKSAAGDSSGESKTDAESDNEGKPRHVHGQNILIQNVNQGFEDDVDDDDSSVDESNDEATDPETSENDRAIDAQDSPASKPDAAAVNPSPLIPSDQAEKDVAEQSEIDDTKTGQESSHSDTENQIKVSETVEGDSPAEFVTDESQTEA